MSGRSGGGGGGRRAYGGGNSSSQHEVRVKRRDVMDDERGGAGGGGGDGNGKSKGDEVRISKLTRLLARLDTEDSFFTICNQIESALKEEENQRYVSRCFPCLCPSFQEVFKGLPGLPWEVAGSKRFAQLLAMICLSMETSSVKFFQWLVDVIMRSVRGSSSSVSSTAQLAEYVSIQVIHEMHTPDIIIFIKCIYDVLEEVSNPKVFRVLGGIFVYGTNHTAATWRNPHFHDFIDMVVGWMVDVQQSNGQYTSCTELLESAKPQFLIDMGFLVTLMSQLLEDLEKVIKKVQPTSGAESEEFCKILQLIRAFTTLLSLECPVDKMVLTEFSDRLVASTLQFIRMCEPHQNMDNRYRYKLLTTVNKALFFSGGILSQAITKYFRAQLKLGTTNSAFTRWPKPFLSCFLKSITVWVEAAVSQTQLSEDIIEITDVLIDLIEEMKRTLPPHDQHYVMNLLMALLRTRNVNLLQKTYGWLIAKLPSSEKEEQSESVEDDEDVMFVLMGLADLIGNKSSAIFSLWALQPAIFEILVEISNQKIHPRTRHCSLELLKTHCNMHSHFISSVASTGSFNTESPGTRFLPALMDFWIEKLQTLEDSQDLWLLEWIFGFLQNTNSYANQLYHTKADFFERLLSTIFQKRSLILVGADIMKWFCCDSDYIALEQIKLMLQERLVFIILNEKLPDRVKLRYKSVLFNMNQLIVLPDIVFFEDCVESDVSYETEPDDSSHALIFTEFNLFLYELLVGNSLDIPQFTFTAERSHTSSSSNKLLSIAADHLIRMKLKTPIGKPQDFFAQLLLVFKRSRAAKIPVPIWKLHFVFELEKKFQFWTHGSAVDDTELTEHVKQFYTMNKTPFLEWLKKIRLEIIESCMLSQEYSLAYFNAALMGDTSRMEYALYQMSDLYGLKGMGSDVASCYLEGKFEEAFKLMNDIGNSPTNALNDQIRLDLDQMLQDSCAQLQRWSDPVPLEREEIVPNFVKLKSLIELQLTSKKKFDVSFMSSPILLQFLKLPVIQKLHCWLLQLPSESVSEEQVQCFERIKFQKMLDAGNLNYVREWLVRKDLDVNSIISDEDLSNLSLASVPVDTLKICADFYAKKLEWAKSAILYNALRELVTGSIDSDLAVSVTESLVSRIIESDEFFTVFSSESLNESTKSETISSLLQVAVHSFPETSKAWLCYGDFTFSQSGKPFCANLSHAELESLKCTTVQCYSKYIQLQSESGTKTSYLDAYSPKSVVMARLLQCFKEGYKFSLEETINSEDWLILIAEIAQIPEMISFIVEKFPNQAALFFTSYDSERVPNKRTVRRRNLFDLSPYSYVDTSEEPLNSSLLLSNLSHLEKLATSTKEPEKTNQFEFHFRSNLKIPSCATLFTRELLHVASSMEDMWVWSLERIAVDWTRRISYLRKECNRSLSSEKIQTFIQPILTYLNALVSATEQSQSIVDVNFLNRHKAGIQNYLDQLLSSRSLEEVALAMNSLLKYSERFGIVANNKLPLNIFSTKLADPNFYQSSDFSICLPGQPSHIKISCVFHVIHALPTKTKPKRIRVLATNGKYYDYLVKGTENLNIDCGVMQFLKISQSFFRFPTRTYSVTPLGKRGGLIQIVPDAIPLFALYKKHLQRNKCLEKTSEMFWRRMNSLGYEDRSSIAAQREVYESLCSETSCDLITRELFLSSQTPSQWLDSLQTFTRDCSIGSAIGYLLGIGDRHLDNMLVNISHGKFIHVDFSIIFGKGASLRIPEKVPFRLTQNLASVLQYPGPMGSFYYIMQDVLKAFQEYRDTAVHLIKNIAFCHLYDEDAPVDLSKVLASEVESAVKLFMCRASQYLSLLQPIRNDVLQTIEDLDSVRQLYRKINRWRRMLVNLNTVLQFVIGTISADCDFKDVLEIIQSRWIPMFQLSLEMGMEPQSQTSEKFLELLDTTEKLLVQLQASFSDVNKLKEMETLKLQDANAQVIDMDKVEVLVKYAEINIQTYSPKTSVKRLIDEATNIDNLAQMYEGWTPWV